MSAISCMSRTPSSPYVVLQLATMPEGNRIVQDRFFFHLVETAVEINDRRVSFNMHRLFAGEVAGRRRPVSG